MNHDYAHCWDYEKGVCPEDCFRAKLTDDLKNWPYPVTYSKFKETEACPLTHPQQKHTNCDRLVSESPEELAVLFEDMGDCPPRACPHDGEGANVTRKDCLACWRDWLTQEATNDP